MSGGRIVGLCLGCFLLIVFFIMGGCSLSCVPAGHVGVVDVFGNVKDYTLKPGINFPVNPFAKIVKMPVRTMEAKEEDFTVTTKEGLSVKLDISVWYNLDAEKALLVYKKIGDNYVEKILDPAIRGIMRDAISEYGCEQLYDISSRQMVCDKARTLIAKELEPRGINIERMLLRDIEFPNQVRQAIDAKMAMKQQAEQMQFVLQKETQEAERRRVEAGGIADAQVIISKQLTPEYLQWKYIEALVELVDTPNHSTIILPFDSKLTPMLQLPVNGSPIAQPKKPAEKE
jgi:prohibitin 1